jgi:hypothetical protein
MISRIRNAITRFSYEPPFRLMTRFMLEQFPVSVQTRAGWDISDRPAYLLGLVTAADKFTGLTLTAGLGGAPPSPRRCSSAAGLTLTPAATISYCSARLSVTAAPACRRSCSTAGASPGLPKFRSPCTFSPNSMRGRRSTTSICPDVEMGEGAKRRRTADAKWAYERAR